jgi:hypothetical protein
MDELTPGQEEALAAATAGAIQRITMALLEFPKEERAAQYPVVRKSLKGALAEGGIQGALADAWLNSTMIGIESLVSEIETGGGAVGGQA